MGKLIRVIFIVLGTLSVSACAQVQIDLGSVQNGRDRFPIADPEAAFGGNLDELTQGEALIVAKSSDGVYSSTSPETAEISFYTLRDPAKSKTEDSEELDFYNINSIKFLKDKNGNWSRSDTLEINENTPSSMIVPFQVIAFNNGTDDFVGNLAIFDRLGGDLKFSRLIKHSKIKDSRTQKAVLGSLPYIGLLALAIDDFTEIESGYSFEDRSSGSLLELRINEARLAPGEGVLVEFESNLDISRFKK